MRRYVADLLRQRDALVDAALALVVDNDTGKTVGTNVTPTGSNKDNGIESHTGSYGLAAQELVDWQERLREESQDLSPIDFTLDGALGIHDTFLCLCVG